MCTDGTEVARRAVNSAALLLQMKGHTMNSRMIHLLVAAGVLLLTTVAGAQENTATTSSPDAIFSSIMRTMPSEMRTQIDSASAVQQTRSNTGTATQSTSDQTMQTTAAADAKQASIDKLPESVQEQVRKTIKELEKGTIERRIQFKEFRNQDK